MHYTNGCFLFYVFLNSSNCIVLIYDRSKYHLQWVYRRICGNCNLTIIICGVVYVQHYREMHIVFVISLSPQTEKGRRWWRRHGRLLLQNDTYLNDLQTQSLYLMVFYVFKFANEWILFDILNRKKFLDQL